MEGVNQTKDYYKILRNLVRVNSPNLKLLKDLSIALSIDVAITSESKTLYGEPLASHMSFPLLAGELAYGYLLSTNDKGRVVADIIQSIVLKEIQKKNIGTEVLGLYREINMIYNFSEMISEKINDVSIAETALAEAQQIIDITHGSVFVYNDTKEDVIQMARLGRNPSETKSVKNQNEILKKLIETGTSAIVPISAIKTNTALNHLESVMYAPLKVKNRNLGLIVLGNEIKKEFTAAELKLLTTIALQSAAAIESAQLYQKGLQEAKDRENAIKIVHEASQKFVPYEFIKSLGKTALTEVELGDRVERNVTVMFVDIRGFTTLSEVMSPSENFDFVNGFNARMGPIIRTHEGFIMQYLGDGFMALFPKGPQFALRAAVAMQSALRAYNEDRHLKNRLPVAMGIGMQNGNLIMGITGDNERLDAAIISDTVNTAARIEGLSKYYGTSIMLTNSCIENLENPSEFNFRYLGPVKVKGKEQSIELYECIDGDEPQLTKHKSTSLNTFEEAMKLYFSQDFAMAAVTFQKVVKKNINDYPAKLFLNRSAHLITQELDDNWKGVEAIDKK